MSTETEFAWAAGFIDGDGCFSVQRRTNSIKAVLTATQVEKAVLIRLQLAIGGRVNGPYTRNSDLFSQKPYWFYTLSHAQLLLVIKELWPYLSKPKRTQYNKVIAELKQVR